MKAGCDAVPVAANGFEGVVYAEGWVAEMFKLLQNRIGQARLEGIPTEHQHRQAVGVGQCCGCQKVCRARASGSCAEHETLPQPLFGVGRGSEAHALFVLSTVKG